MAKRLSVILIALMVMVINVIAYGGERYPDRGTDFVTANVGTQTETIVTSSITGYWVINAETDVRFSWGETVTDTHPLLKANTWINLFPVRIYKSGSTVSPASIHLLADSATGNVSCFVIKQ